MYGIDGIASGVCTGPEDFTNGGGDGGFRDVLKGVFEDSMKAQNWQPMPDGPVWQRPTPDYQGCGMDCPAITDLDLHEPPEPFELEAL
jgi:hypothetical protein